MLIMNVIHVHVSPSFPEHFYEFIGLQPENVTFFSFLVRIWLFMVILTAI